MMSDRLLIAVPMKDPTRSKTRLRTAISDADRQYLALALFERTLDTIADADCDVAVLVVTESDFIAKLCQARGLFVYHEKQSQGLNAAATKASGWAKQNGYQRMAILPADLALLSVADIALLAAQKIETGQVVLCEATDGGTNCLLLCPPNAIAFRFGPGSFRAHRHAAMSGGIICHVLRDSDMRFDIDTSQDLHFIQNRDWQSR